MEKKIEYGGFIEVTMEDMQHVHLAPTVGEVMQALECCQSKEKKMQWMPSSQVWKWLLRSAYRR